jgi:hypothetical protein
VRIFLITLLFTLLTFAVSLLTGILGVIVLARLKGTQPQLAVAYRSIAVPIAAVAGVIFLVLAIAMEIRHYRQTRALAGIERAS